MFLHLCVILFTRGGLCPSMHHRSHDQGGVCPGGFCLRGFLSGRSLSSWVSVQGVSVWGVSVRESPPYGNERVVCILLEYILVFSSN